MRTRKKIIFNDSNSCTKKQRNQYPYLIDNVLFYLVYYAFWRFIRINNVSCWSWHCHCTSYANNVNICFRLKKETFSAGTYIYLLSTFFCKIRDRRIYFVAAFITKQSWNLSRYLCIFVTGYGWNNSSKSQNHILLISMTHSFILFD